MIQIEASKQAEHEQSMHAVKLEQGEMTGWGIVSVWMCVCTILHGVVRM
jgi:hypothetical protein